MGPSGPDCASAGAVLHPSPVPCPAVTSPHIRLPGGPRSPQSLRPHRSPRAPLSPQLVMVLRGGGSLEAEVFRIPPYMGLAAFSRACPMHEALVVLELKRPSLQRDGDLLATGLFPWDRTRLPSRGFPHGGNQRHACKPQLGVVGVVFHVLFFPEGGDGLTPLWGGAGYLQMCAPAPTARRWPQAPWRSTCQ